MTVGEKIQQRRKEKGWSQEDLAEQVGVSRQSISLWEKDQTTPSLENMKTLCRLFQISMDELLGQTPLPSPTQPPPPPAMVTTHWSPAFLKRALGMLHRKYLAVTLGFAVTLMVLGILFAVLGWAAGEDYGANLAGFLFYSLIFWVFWLLRRIQIQRVVKRHTALHPNHVTTLEFYPGYIHIQSRSDRSSSSNDWSYQSLKAVRCDGEIIVLQGPESMNAFYLADLQGDALWVLSALKANAKKYSAPNWLLPNRLPVKHPVQPGLKGKRYYLWKNILLVLFIASLGCLLFAMPLCALLSRLGGLPEFTRYLWGFLPAASHSGGLHSTGLLGNPAGYSSKKECDCRGNYGGPSGDLRFHRLFERRCPFLGPCVLYPGPNGGENRASGSRFGGYPGFSTLAQSLLSHRPVFQRRYLFSGNCCSAVPFFASGFSVVCPDGGFHTGDSSY